MLSEAQVAALKNKGQESAVAVDNFEIWACSLRKQAQLQQYVCCADHPVFYTTSLIFSAPAIVLIVWLHKKRARRPQHSKFALTCTDILDCSSQLRHVLTYSQHMLHKQRATSRTQMRTFPASVQIAASLACNKRALGTAARARAMAIFYRLLGPKQPE